jgi:UDP-N-acetylmuramyl tripeptide synthase
LLIEYLRSFKNEYLDDTLNYIEQMINYTIEQYRKIGEDLAYCNVEKIYLTMNNKNDNGAELELEMYKAFFKQDVETFVNRKDALVKIARESKENDIILLAGRGNNTTYSGEYSSENFDDLDITVAELEVEEYDY